MPYVRITDVPPNPKKIQYAIISLSSHKGARVDGLAAELFKTQTVVAAYLMPLLIIDTGLVKSFLKNGKKV